MYETGDRVKTPGGTGSVVFKRMQAPDYSRVEAYSIRLDSEMHRRTYTGTMFKAEEVQKF